MWDNRLGASEMKRPTKETIRHLCQVLEWAVGNRGRKDVNPYCVREVRGALEHLAYLSGMDDYLDVNTEQVAKEL